MNRQVCGFLTDYAHQLVLNAWILSQATCPDSLFSQNSFTTDSSYVDRKQHRATDLQFGNVSVTGCWMFGVKKRPCEIRHHGPLILKSGWLFSPGSTFPYSDRPVFSCQFSLLKIKQIGWAILYSIIFWILLRQKKIERDFPYLRRYLQHN